MFPLLNYNKYDDYIMSEKLTLRLVVVRYLGVTAIHSSDSDHNNEILSLNN